MKEKKEGKSDIKETSEVGKKERKEGKQASMLQYILSTPPPPPSLFPPY
jgi:hypothetical protein